MTTKVVVMSQIGDKTGKDGNDRRNLRRITIPTPNFYM